MVDEKYCIEARSETVKGLLQETFVGLRDLAKRLGYIEGELCGQTPPKECEERQENIMCKLDTQRVIIGELNCAAERILAAIGEVKR